MATYALQGHVTDDHRLEVELPEDAPTGEVEVTITFREGRTSGEAFLALLEKWKRQPLSYPRRTREEIDADLARMRDEWDSD